MAARPNNVIEGGSFLCGAIYIRLRDAGVSDVREAVYVVYHCGQEGPVEEDGGKAGWFCVVRQLCCADRRHNRRDPKALEWKMTRSLIVPKIDCDRVPVVDDAPGKIPVGRQVQLSG